MNGVPSAEESRRQLALVLRSRAFQHAEALRKMLAYLGEKSLQGSASELKEYVIGVEALGRPQTYDPRTDSSVRVQVGKLRQRLREYFEEEGASDPVRIDFPKGSFTLQFASREVAEARPAAETGGRGWRWACGVLLCLWVAAFVLARWLPSQQTTLAVTNDSQAGRDLFWSSILRDKKGVVVAIGTPLFVKQGGVYARNPRVNTWEEHKRIVGSLHPHGAEATRASYRYTGVGEAAGLMILARLFQATGNEILFKRSSSLAWDDIRERDLVLIGPPKFIPHIRDFPVRRPFAAEDGRVVETLADGKAGRVFDGTKTPASDERPEEYAVITKLRGLAGYGEIVMLESTATEGTWAAAEFISRPGNLRLLHDKLRLADGGYPACYQVIVKGTFRDLVPISVTYVTHRAIEARTETLYKSP